MKAFFLALVASVFTSAAFAAVCDADKVTLRGAWGEAGFSVEVVDNDETRAQGLMFRESMPRFSGMLFVYDQPGHARFWMKNTLIPLDMLFLDENGVVTRIHENAIPGDLTSIDGGLGVLAVLEINGGVSKMLGIKVGSEVRHPAFGDKATWACN